MSNFKVLKHLKKGGSYGVAANPKGLYRIAEEEGG
jgi:hypothetical protein